MKITKDISIEELVETVPESVRYLMEKGIKCIACGEPIWGTLEDAAKQKGFTEDDIECFVNDLQTLHYNPKVENNPEIQIETKKFNTD